MRYINLITYLLTYSTTNRTPKECENITARWPVKRSSVRVVIIIRSESTWTRFVVGDLDVRLLTAVEQTQSTDGRVRQTVSAADQTTPVLRRCRQVLPRRCSGRHQCRKLVGIRQEIVAGNGVSKVTDFISSGTLNFSLRHSLPAHRVAHAVWCTEERRDATNYTLYKTIIF